MKTIFSFRYYLFHELLASVFLNMLANDVSSLSMCIVDFKNCL